MSTERTIRKLLVAWRDAVAVRRGPRAVTRRVGRRIYGRATGRLAARIFR